MTEKTSIDEIQQRTQLRDQIRIVRLSFVQGQ